MAARSYHLEAEQSRQEQTVADRESRNCSDRSVDVQPSSAQYIADAASTNCDLCTRPRIVHSGTTCLRDDVPCQATSAAILEEHLASVAAEVAQSVRSFDAASHSRAEAVASSPSVHSGARSASVVLELAHPTEADLLAASHWIVVILAVVKMDDLVVVVHHGYNRVASAVAVAEVVAAHSEVVAVENEAGHQGHHHFVADHETVAVERTAAAAALAVVEEDNHLDLEEVLHHDHDSVHDLLVREVKV